MTGTTVTQATDPAADAASLLNLIAGGAMTQIVHAVAALNIADHLAGEPRTAKEVAAREGSNERTTFRLMRAAASLGLLSYEGEGRFGLTGMGGLLRSDTPVSLRPMALVQAAPSHWQPWGLFPEAVRKGESQAGKALGADIFDYYARPENAEMARIFSEAMGGMSAMVTQGVVAGADLEGVSTVVDVGGADGHLVLALMEARPELRGQVLDLPHAVEGAVEEAARRGLSDRFSGAAGDFFAEVPTADLHVLKTVLHDWDDDRALRILRNCRAAAGEEDVRWSWRWSSRRSARPTSPPSPTWPCSASRAASNATWTSSTPSSPRPAGAGAGRIPSAAATSAWNSGPSDHDEGCRARHLRRRHFRRTTGRRPPVGGTGRQFTTTLSPDEADRPVVVLP